jgi:O-methyltransferase domain/Dimerisation domain
MVTAQPDPPPSARLLQLATASWMSAAISAAATLGVADDLANGPRTVGQTATALDADPPTLYRLMRACADFGLFDEVTDQTFRLTELGQVLRSDVPGSMRNFAMWVGTPADRYTWAHLARSVQVGKSSFEYTHGRHIWAYLRDNDELARVFNRAMTEASSGLIAPVVQAYDFTKYATIVDVGGGHGALLASVLASAPLARGVLFDQPAVIAGAGRQLRDAGVSDRCELRAGDFFTSVPDGGDAYLLSNIIHDWDDKPAGQILSNCAEAMVEGGRVLLVEALMPGGCEPAPTVKLMDLNMLVLCDGKQRTEAEFAKLFDHAGLRLSRIVPGGLCSVIEAVRKLTPLDGG